MKVYFGASVTLDRSLLPMYQKIVSEIKSIGHTVLSEYVVDPKLQAGAGLSPKKLFARETATIDKADLMVAEVTLPSWGTAFLMEHALKKGRPVLALFFQEADHPLPLMIQGHPDLYVAHYDDDSLKNVLKKNLDHLEQMKSRKGKLIVIDGADGSGKATQTERLVAYFKKHHLPHKYISFPRYKTSFHGKHVGRFLKGEFGGNGEVRPYLSSLAFALDRLTARDQLVDWLKEGNLVIADRYVSASLAHQGSKVSSEKRSSFLDWLYTMEYLEHKLPKEDIVIYLYVPLEVSQELIKKRGSADIADSDLDHQSRTITLYQELVKKYPHWVMITCVDKKGKLLAIDAIHQQILEVLRQRHILPSSS